MINQRGIPFLGRKNNDLVIPKNASIKSDIVTDKDGNKKLVHKLVYDNEEKPRSSKRERERRLKQLQRGILK